ncbi:NADH-quinone oxidoreductase subunit J [Rickettsiales endosymbiont of Stachyamoeba lipophora]|uniref:NADH-quinone oxidoreductase subunit J n=1 Tax=Rickettsiales endosymbiont of Stachyamoeba lipophora TaxID=2486578 RepID=UPI000F65295E|nr:NADH-quinone oxidoreductase subunit J [Rickettsiales endosymbiont of Stachyamoeba lipophora]AZL15999.1 NADH-quinone oxidoreductase subunit J [Rickettsiales endosymbiont of Stachyamoeba lipophora]
MIIASIFYFFAFLTILFAGLTISFKNPVHSVLSLVMVFFNTAALFILIGAEFIAATLIIVYVGAVAVLFLFVIMMFDIKVEQVRTAFNKNIPFALIICFILVIDLLVINYNSFATAQESNLYHLPNLPETMSNTHYIGSVLYTDYVLAFQIAGIILLVAMIGSILLTLRARENVKKQNITAQNNRTRDTGVKLIKIKVGDGVDVK